MPSLAKFLFICLLIAGVCYGTLFAISVSYKPEIRTISSDVSLEKLKQ